VILAARVFTVLAAALGVGAVALAGLLPVGYMLSDTLVMASPGSLKWLEEASTLWMWDWVEMPLLVRPAWLIPAGLGLIAGGLATSVSLRVAPSRHRS